MRASKQPRVSEIITEYKQMEKGTNSTVQTREAWQPGRGGYAGGQTGPRYQARGPYRDPQPGSYPPRFPLTSFKVRGYERYVPDYARRDTNPTQSRRKSPPRPRTCTSPDGGTRRRSRTLEQSSRYVGRYRSPTPRDIWSPSQRHVRQNQDGDIMMKGSVDEEWLVRRAYDSGRADERRRLLRIVMTALNSDGESRKDVAGEELVAL